MSWVMEHPWMTFIIVLVAIEAVGNIVDAICKAVVSCKQRECKLESQETELPVNRDCGNMDVENE